MSFSENLIKYRKMKAYTQDDIAELIGVSRQSVSKWENGEAMPDINKVVKIAECLEVSLDVLFDRDEILKTEQNIVAKQDVNIELKPNLMRTILIAVVVLFLGGVLGVAMGIGIGDNRSKEKSEKTTEEIRVSAFAFSPLIEGKNGMKIEFVPSKYSDNFEYSILAYADDSYYDRKGSINFENGVCRCSLNTVAGVLYNIVLQISNGDEVQYITLAEKVWGDGSGQNISSNENNISTLSN